MRELKELICYFLTNAPHALNKTEVIKFIYLFEYYHVQTYGDQYTDIDFIRYKYGPYSREIEECLNALIFSENLIDREITTTPYGNHSYLHRVKNNDILSFYMIDTDKKYIADVVIGELSNKKHTDLIEVVYDTPPMAKIIKNENRSSSKQLGRELDMTEYKPVKKFNREKIEAARKRLDKSSKGSDREYYACLLKEKLEFETLRKRANECLLK